MIQIQRAEQFTKAGERLRQEPQSIRRTTSACGEQPCPCLWTALASSPLPGSANSLLSKEEEVLHRLKS
jgi:hypothetical protein